MYRTLLLALATQLLLVPGGVLADAKKNVPLYVMTGVNAKLYCSELFVSGRPRQDVDNEFRSELQIYDVDVDETAKRVTLSVADLQRQAIFRDGLGCTLTYDDDPDTPSKTHPIDAGTLSSAAAKSSGYRLERHADKALLAQVDKHLEYRLADDEGVTRALLVLRDGKIVGERYAKGFDAQTHFNGYSLGKGVMNALVGVAVENEWLDIHTAPAVTAWSDAADSRSNITVDNLLRMSSGLNWREGAVQNYTMDVYVMLAGVPDTSGYAGAKLPRAEPGASWRYSTGNTQIVSRALREAVTGGGADYHAFPRQYLFNKLGMDSAILEVDSAGNFIGGALMYATARDWAKFGQLYLQDGVWSGERILPEGWVDYTLTPTHASGKRIDYGAHFWLASPQRFGGNTPPGSYYLRGYEDQYLIVVPSLNLVAVRFGESCLGAPWQARSLMTSLVEMLQPDAHAHEPAMTSSR